MLQGFYYETIVLPLSVWQVWSVTTGALMDTLCGSLAPVTSVLLYKAFVVSASAAATYIQMWNLKYDAQHKPAAHIPSGCIHVAIDREADQVFYVLQPGETEVMSWNSHTGRSEDLTTTDLIVILCFLFIY